MNLWLGIGTLDQHINNVLFGWHVWERSFFHELFKYKIVWEFSVFETFSHSMILCSGCGTLIECKCLGDSSKDIHSKFFAKNSNTKMLLWPHNTLRSILLQKYKRQLFVSPWDSPIYKKCNVITEWFLITNQIRTAKDFKILIILLES